MVVSPERFAQLLTEGIQRIRVREGKPIRVIQDELGYLLGREGGAAVEHWRKGRLPPHLADIEALARALVTRGGLDQEWLEHFLTSAGYPAPALLGNELFPVVQRTRTVSRLLRPELPISTTALVGRQQELALLAQLLADPSCRLITLVGPGGIGKTRLALQAAADYIHKYGTDVIFVPLVALASPKSIAPAIAEALRLEWSTDEDLPMQLCDALSGQTLLLVLDNFEHLLEGATLVVEILQSAPSVRALITSRERLSVQGEWLIELDGLEVPPCSEMEVMQFKQYAAADLFLQRVRQVDPSFVADTTQNEAIARICRLVRGMPLALELAATWVRVLSCAEIMQEIERNLGFLATTQRDMPLRHRSLEVVFNHSWQLLTPDEQRAFARLSIFRSSFTRKAAEQVTHSTLPLIAALIDKSLLRRVGTDSYEMHEFARQFASTKLHEIGEWKTTSERHIEYFISLAEEDLQQFETTLYYPQYLYRYDDRKDE